VKTAASLLAGALALALVSSPPAAAVQRPPPPPPAGFTSCCPPWTSTQLQSMLVYQGSGGISGPYTLKFVPTALLHAQLNAYVTYLQTLGLGFTNLLINFQLIDAGTGNSPVPGVLVNQQPVSWTGTGTPTPTLFPNNLMVVNRWYRIRTQIILGGNPPPGFMPRECIVRYVDVRLQVLPGARAARPVLQMRDSDGRNLDRPLNR